MSVNKERPHLVILPEDEADAEIANGFLLSLKEGTNVGILPEAGGWHTVVEEFCKYEVVRMRRYPHRRVVLLVDFDGDAGRVDTVKRSVPTDLQDRVFILGPLTTPQRLSAQLRTKLEAIGGTLASECREDVFSVWNHPLLAHNGPELLRLRNEVRNLLFQR